MELVPHDGGRVIDTALSLQIRGLRSCEPLVELFDDALERLEIGRIVGNEAIRTEVIRADLLSRPRAVAVGRPREPNLPVRQRRRGRLAEIAAWLRRLRDLGELRPAEIHAAIERGEQHLNVAGVAVALDVDIDLLPRRPLAPAVTFANAEQRAVVVRRCAPGVRATTCSVSTVRSAARIGFGSCGSALPMCRADGKPRDVLELLEVGEERVLDRPGLERALRELRLRIAEERRLVDAQLGIDPVLWIEEDLAVRLPDAILAVPLPLQRIDPGRRNLLLQAEQDALDEQLYARDRLDDARGLTARGHLNVDQEVLEQ